MQNDHVDVADRAALRRLVENAAYDNPGDRERALENFDRETGSQAQQRSEYFQDQRDAAAEVAAVVVEVVLPGDLP